MTKKEIAADAAKGAGNGIIKDFEAAIDKFRSLVIENFYCRIGEEDKTEPFEKQIIKIFKESPKEIRPELKDYALQTLSAPGPGRNNGLYGARDNCRRIKTALQEAANQMADRLEKIQ